MKTSLAAITFFLFVTFASAQSQTFDLRRLAAASELHKDLAAFTDALKKWNDQKQSRAYAQLVVSLGDNLVNDLDSASKANSAFNPRLYLQLKAEVLAITENISRGYNYEIQSKFAGDEALNAISRGNKEDKTLQGLFAAGVLLLSGQQAEAGQEQVAKSIESSLEAFLSTWRTAGGTDNYIDSERYYYLYAPESDKRLLTTRTVDSAPITWERICPLSYAREEVSSAGKSKSPDLRNRYSSIRGKITLITHQGEEDILCTTGRGYGDIKRLKAGTMVDIVFQTDALVGIILADKTIGIVLRSNCHFNEDKLDIYDKI